MSILHGSWIVKPANSYFFLWGETWRNLEASSVSQHPFNLTLQELQAFLQSQHLYSDSLSQDKWQTETINLPSQKIARKKEFTPFLSEQFTDDTLEKKSVVLQTWQVAGFRLNPNETIQLLQALPLGNLQEGNSYLGDDLRFWTHIYRWSLDLLARGKFLPGLSRQESEFKGQWYPLLDSSSDRARFAKFLQLMPAVCEAYDFEGQNDKAQELLLGFLREILDAQIRPWLASISPPKEPFIEPWLKSLTQVSSDFTASEKEVKRIETALYNWTLPVRDSLATPTNQKLGQDRFQISFSLQPPISNSDGEQIWHLQYYLQALDNPEFLVDAQTIWQNPIDSLVFQGRTIEHPQETFLKGLGLASRIYPLIEESLQQEQPKGCELNSIQVYEFIKAIAWQLQDSGLGVKLPPGLASGTEERRLGIQLKAEVNTKKGERLNLKSLLNYELKIAVGDRAISKQEFERLLAQKSPLVEVDGEWIALQPADVRAAKAVLEQSNEPINLSVEDALRLSSGDTKVLAKLPIVSFETSGALKELIDNFTNNQAIEPIEKPVGFKGELRPYQARGVGWLAFLEKWGLGACLADDMGLGKCLAPESSIYVNGLLQSAQEIWEKYTQDQEIEFDGEGFWSVSKSKLLVNSIDETIGKIVQAPIQRLYRQQVREKLRKITLQDGSNITITQQHKLLTNNGWTNRFQVGDYICTPAKMLWTGQSEDEDLVKFLAWQIAEGYETEKDGRVSITQKDLDCLDDLLQALSRIAQRYNIQINNPKICVFPARVSALKITSKAYQRFLQVKGYEWGKRSKEKSIPPFIMQADLNSIRVFLSHYFDAEGSVLSNMRTVEISTASPVLIKQVSVLLRRFGIWLRIASKQKRATNGTGIFRTYYIGTLGGNSARRFLQEIGFNYSAKQYELVKICEKISNTNVEGIPVSNIVAEAVKVSQLPICHFGMYNTVYLNGSQQFSHTSLEKVVSAMGQILGGVTEQEYRQKKPSKWTNQTLQAYSLLDKNQLEDTRDRLQTFLDQEVFYCQIKKIEEIDYEGWVYDFEVSEHHNFIANNIICHNTIQTLAFLLNLRQQEALQKPVLLVCPTSVLNNWEREVRKFSPTLSTLIHHGDKRNKGKTFANEVKKKNLVITSYPLIFRDATTFEQVEWQGIVLDEAQNIKNPQAKQSQAVRKLKTEFRIALTGTPVENRLSELWSILDFLNPGFLGAQQFFQRRFAIPIEKYGDRESLKILRSLVQPFILRRLKTDKDIIQDLPEKQEMNVFCGLSAEQAKIYQQLVEESLAKIEESTGIQRRGLILTLLVKLKQICNHPSHFLKEDTINLSERSGKLLRLEEMLEELLEEGDRALIFTQFSEWGKLLQAYLEKKFKREILFLYGGTRSQQRQEMIDRFQNDPNGPRIFILSLKAGGTGLNLTRANHVFHVDRWWNPAVENQATDRAFRIGQKQNVQVHKFVCTGTLEERINDTIESKKQLAELTVDSGEQWLTELDTDQLRNLLLLERNAVIEEEDT